MCREIDEPVDIPLQDSIKRLKNELPERGKEQNAILSFDTDTLPSSNLIPPVKVHSSNLEASVLLSIAIYLLKFSGFAVDGLTH